MTSTENKNIRQDSVSGYAPVNGLNMYYEIHGKGMPLVLIHGAGSTIQTTFGRVLHSFAKERQVIAVELQGHGHTPDIDRPETFEQDADDVAAVLKYLKIENADFLGFSNGGNAAMQIAMRRPALVRKIILASTFFKREGLYQQFWESLGPATLKDMPQLLKEAYNKVAPDSNDLIKMFEKDKQRMMGFKDWKAEDIRAIHAPALIIVGDQDVIRPEHAVEMYRLLPHARLSIIPGAHGGYIGEITTGMENSKLPDLTVSMIEEFLNEPGPKTN
ncbi:MAG: alpha/beta hydrolase [Bacteroidota bacterium]|nr:alpha/beta hydrolase [Bacteroidota bacterium]